MPVGHPCHAQERAEGTPENRRFPLDSSSGTGPPHDRHPLRHVGPRCAGGVHRDLCCHRRQQRATKANRAKSATPKFGLKLDANRAPGLANRRNRRVTGALQRLNPTYSPSGAYSDRSYARAEP
jgi:hypothetical protein